MEILKPGTVRDEAYEVNCIKCRALYRFQRHEGKLFWDKGVRYLFAVCPTPHCGQNAVVKVREVE